MEAEGSGSASSHHHRHPSTSPTSPTSPIGDDNTSVKPTRSRRGCFSCRRRKVKCDENAPTCRNCTIGNREVSQSLDFGDDNCSRLLT